jgi:transposase InsO family protein
LKKEKDSEKLFRFSVVSALKAELLKGLSLPDAIKVVSKDDHFTPEGEIKNFSARTLYRWYQSFEREGPSALSNKSKEGVRNQRLTEQEMKFIKTTKESDPLASVPEVIKQGVLKNKLSKNVSRTTVYRACKKMNLPLLRSSGPKNLDMRRFAYPNRMMMVLCDGKHFRAGATRKKRVALIFIDDATRFILHCAVGTSENTALFLKGLYAVITRYGLMRSLYLDKGPGFRSFETAGVVSKLGINLIHGKTRYPQGHGKIERFNRTIYNDLIRGLCRESVDPDLNSLNLRFKHYVEKIYNQSDHSSLQGKRPHDVFHGNEYPLNFPNDFEMLKDKFVLSAQRKVSKDNVISVNGNSLELPTGYAGRVVDVFKNILKNEVSIYHNGTRVQLFQVNLELNAKSKRGDIKSPSPSSSEVKLAADIAYEDQMAPLVDDDGNYFEEEQC